MNALPFRPMARMARSCRRPRTGTSRIRDRVVRVAYGTLTACTESADTATRVLSTHTPWGYIVASMEQATRGYSATKDQLRTRLRRIEGQVRGLQRMVDEDTYCIDVLTQISAVQAALDKVALGLLDDHAQHCVLGASDDTKEERTQELMASVARLMRRG